MYTSMRVTLRSRSALAMRLLLAVAHVRGGDVDDLASVNLSL